MKIVILDGSAANPGDINWDAIAKYGDLTVYDVTTEDVLIERAQDAEILITNKTPFTEETISQLPKLKYIGVLATGYNVVDLEACSKRDIVVTNVPEYGTYATMQMTIALMLEMTNHVAIHNDAVQNGEWIKSSQFCFWNKPLTELWGKTITIVGYGKIGQAVSRTCLALGMNVIAVPHDSSKFNTTKGEITFKSYEDALPISDFISFHCPLTAETKLMVNKDTISKMKKGVFIINAARGGLINESDMKDALISNHVAGFAADVISVEPMLPDNPLQSAPNVILTPHIAWAPKETRMRLIDAAADNIKAFLEGAPINKVN